MSTRTCPTHNTTRRVSLTHSLILAQADAFLQQGRLQRDHWCLLAPFCGLLVHLVLSEDDTDTLLGILRFHFSGRDILGRTEEASVSIGGGNRGGWIGRSYIIAVVSIGVSYGAWLVRVLLYLWVRQY